VHRLDNNKSITLTLRPLPSDIPATVRIRMALKCLLRTYRLRCTDISTPPEENDDDQPTVHS
jgi:hypothetical protein